jgi:hypothetical protein
MSEELIEEKSSTKEIVNNEEELKESTGVKSSTKEEIVNNEVELKKEVELKQQIYDNSRAEEIQKIWNDTNSKI